MALSSEDKQRIEKAVTAAESQTSAEFVVVVAHASEQYAAFPLLWSALVALVVGGGTALALPNVSGRMIFIIEAILFVVSGLVLYTKPLRFRLVPNAIRTECARRVARLQFGSLVHERTRGEAGLLLFVSLAERHVEILVDRGIASRVPQPVWEKIVEDFVIDVRAGQTIEGILATIERCTSVLREHFPTIPGDRNEIVDHVTEI
jgi:putative membrane protein